MAEFIIESGVPIPSVRNRHYNFDDLGVDQTMTIFLDNSGKETMKELIGAVRNAIWAYKQVNGNSAKVFETRTLTEEKKVMVRRNK